MKKLIIAIMVLALVLANLYIFYPAFTSNLLSKTANFLDMIFNPEYVRNIMLSHSDQQPEEAPEESDFVIVIDPGHGGRDPGAISTDGSLIESEINFAIAQGIAEMLGEYDEITVYLTHEITDKQQDSPEIAQRVQFACDVGADLLVSIHNNANYSDYSGCEIYVSGRVETQTAADASELAHIMIEKLGNLGMRRRGVFYRLSQAGWTDDTGKVNDYYGIIRIAQENRIPAVLVENAFLNELDAGFISDEQAIEAVARAHAESILEYLSPDSSDAQQNEERHVPGDVNADGLITIDDRMLAQAAVMCGADAPVLEMYDRADVNSSGLVDAYDLYAIREMSQPGGMQPEYSPTSERADCIISADTAVFSPGDIVTVWVQVGNWQDILSAAGTLDYNTEAFDFIEIEAECEGLVMLEDTNYGLVRFVYLPSGGASGAAAFALRFRMVSPPQGEALSFNLNCYSAIYELNGAVFSMMPNCAQTVMSVSE